MAHRKRELGGKCTEGLQPHPPALPPNTRAKISKQIGWLLVRDSRDMVGLLKLIRNITHNQDETNHDSMSVVECNLEMMLGFQEKYQSLDDFMQFVWRNLIQ